jgi:hypothetical protein
VVEKLFQNFKGVIEHKKYFLKNRQRQSFLWSLIQYLLWRGVWDLERDLKNDDFYQAAMFSPSSFLCHCWKFFNTRHCHRWRVFESTEVKTFGNDLVKDITGTRPLNKTNVWKFLENHLKTASHLESRLFSAINSLQSFSKDLEIFSPEKQIFNRSECTYV